MRVPIASPSSCEGVTDVERAALGALVDREPAGEAVTHQRHSMALRLGSGMTLFAARAGRHDDLASITSVGAVHAGRIGREPPSVRQRTLALA